MPTPQELAAQVAQRNAESVALLADLDRRAREAATARLAPYGDTLPMYEARFNEVYNPSMTANRMRAEAMQKYATGLGDILVQRARDARRSSGATTSTFDPYGGYYVPTLQELLALYTAKPQTTGGLMVGSADANERRINKALGRTTSPATARYGSADAQERRLG